MVKFVSTAKGCQVFYFPPNIYIAELCAASPLCYRIVCAAFTVKMLKSSPEAVFQRGACRRHAGAPLHHISKESFSACKAENSSCAELCIYVGANSSNRPSCTQCNGAEPAVVRSSSSVLALTQRHAEQSLKHQSSGSHHTVLFSHVEAFAVVEGNAAIVAATCGAGSLFDTGLLCLARCTRVNGVR